MEKLYSQLSALAQRCGARRLVLFGSRARGDNHYNSDIDLAVYGMPESRRAEFWLDCEELPTLLKFDIVHITEGINPAFLANIERDGVTLMDKLHEKYNYFAAAVSRLREALDDYKKNPLDSVRDGSIQRFEFCTELAWKTMREYLLDQGYTEINSPKAVVKQAFAFGIIQDQQAWVELLNDRNLTSHVYDEATAKAIFERIEGKYLALFDEALAYMKDE
ncbi:MAG: HI0074 family nucleotidyltransferase substrate-binding subunit [Faecalibacterium sp.]